MSILGSFDNRVKYSVIAAASVLALAGPVKAGFEWVPPPPQPEVQQQQMVPQAPPLVQTAPKEIPVVVEATPDPVLPPLLPLDSEEPPVQKQVQAPIKPMKQVVTPVPQAEPVDAPVIHVKRMNEPKPMSKQIQPEVLQPEAPVTASSAPTPLQNETIKQLSVSAEPLPEVLPETLAEPPMMGDMPEVAAQPVVQDVPQVAKVKHSVIMSDDAPQSAIESVKKLKIDTQPLKNKAPMAAVVSSEMVPVEPVEAEAAAPQDNENIVEGFGSDMPLALALQQVVPAQYSYSFSQNVNPGQRVSWSGGKAWVEVVQDMIGPLGLMADIRGNVVHIHSQQHSAVEDVQEEQQASLRESIIDPGEETGAQPERTLEAIEQLASAQSGPVWRVQKGDSLKNTLERWGNVSDFDVVWEASHDYPMQKNLEVTGSLKNALQVVLANAMPSDAKSTPEIIYTGGEDAQLIVKDRSAG